jgi:hypothetical protein
MCLSPGALSISLPTSEVARTLRVPSTPWAPCTTPSSMKPNVAGSYGSISTTLGYSTSPRTLQPQAASARCG